MGCSSAFAGASRGSDAVGECVLGRVAQLQGVSNTVVNLLSQEETGHLIAEEGAALLLQ